MRVKGQEKFYIILISTVLLGLLIPWPGAFIKKNGWIVDILIALMYFGIGISMDTKSVIGGISKWRQILYAQIVLFICCPIIAFGIYKVFLPFSSKEAMIGIMFISALATTISSGIMLTESKNGNSILSMYNVVFSQILGVFVAPLVISIVLKTQFSMAVSLSSVIVSLLKKMIAPFILGQCLYKYRKKLIKSAKFVSNNSIFVILYAYVGFASANGYLLIIFKELLVPTLSIIIFSFIIVFFVLRTTKLLKWDNKDRVSLLFTCTMKTLGMGIPMAVLFFPDSNEIALNVSLLIIIYYCFSMFISIFFSGIFLNTTEGVEE